MFFGYIFYITCPTKVSTACIIAPDNDDWKSPIWLSERRTLSEGGFFSIWDVWTRHKTEDETFLPIQVNFYSGIRLVPGNVVTVTIDIYEDKTPTINKFHVSFSIF